jgi:formate dehydrogenase subunit delta
MTGETLQQDGPTGDFKTEHREKLARMAGQIAAFFDAYPDDQAIPAIADHINQFWSRRMRGDFLTAFDATSEELHPLVRQALSLIRPAPAR